MTAPDVQIVMIEPSRIISQGLVSMIGESGRSYHIVRAADFIELQQLVARNPVDVVVLNPGLLQSDSKSFQLLRNEHPGIKWIGVVYSFFDQPVLAQFDGIISINDLPHAIINTIDRVLQMARGQVEESEQESLSDRETDVLKLLVTGLANKEIADKLNISPHTVITHRKNISQKTGIKSVSGLTIYAVVKGLISIEHFSV